MHLIIIIAGIAIILLALVDAFEAIVMPRRVTRRLRLSRLMGRVLWSVWARTMGLLSQDEDREGVSPVDRALGIFGPLMLLVLIIVWAGLLIAGFALVLWGINAAGSAGHTASAGTYFYFSGTTFFTLGLGDVSPSIGIGRAIVVLEAGVGFSFLALIIGYVPPIISRFGERETEITLLDARAGSPPSAVELLCRLQGPDCRVVLDRYLCDWERWTAVLLESHLSYPVLSYFRSQHERQSWLATLTLILDTCSLVLAGVGDEDGLFPSQQARVTFAIARHTVGDLSQVLSSPPQPASVERLPPAILERARELLAENGLGLRPGDGALRQLIALRGLYEPHVASLAAHLRVRLPGWLPDSGTPDDWETTAWQWDRSIVVTALDRDHW